MVEMVSTIASSEIVWKLTSGLMSFLWSWSSPQALKIRFGLKSSLFSSDVKAAKDFSQEGFKT